MFRPDPRVGERQRACGDTHCQRQRRAQSQASWRFRNPSYQKSYRTQRRAACAEAAERDETEPPPPLRLPPELTAFPWDLAQATLGFTGAEILTLLAVLMVRLVNEVKDERFAEKPLSKGIYASSGRDP
jgi:hypothetical protein